MSKLAIDLSKFRKVKSDEHSSTLQHEDGHQFTVVHKKLNAGMKKQLDKLPTHQVQAFSDGGQADYDFTKTSSSKDDLYDPNLPKEDTAAKESLQKLTEYHAGPGSSLVNPESLAKDDIKYIEDYKNNPQSFSPMGASRARRLMSVVNPEPIVSSNPSGGEKLASTLGGYPSVTGSAPMDYQGSPETENKFAGVAPIPAPTPTGSAPQTSQNDPMGIMGPYQSQLQGLNMQEKGQEQIAQAQGNMGKAQAEQLKAANMQRSEREAKYQEANDKIVGERNQLQEEIKAGHVNPKHYLESMSTGGKISTGIGLILGGFGSGLTGGPNLAFQYLQSQIDRDIDAQKTEIGKKQNLLSHNFEASKDLRAATDMTRIHSNDILASNLEMEAAKAKDAATAGTLMNIAGQFKQQSAQIQHNMALQQSMLGGMGQTSDPEKRFQMTTQYLRMNGKDQMAKDMEAKHLPGYPGQASIEVTPEVRKEWNQLENLRKSYDDADEYLKNTNSLGVGWANANKAKGVALERALELQIGQLEGLNRFTHEEAQRYKDLIPNLSGTHFTDQDSAKLKHLQQEVNNHRQTLLQGNGFEVNPHVKPTSNETFKRVTKEGKVAIFDANKKFLRYEQ